MCIAFAKPFKTNHSCLKYLNNRRTRASRNTRRKRNLTSRRFLVTFTRLTSNYFSNITDISFF